VKTKATKETKKVEVLVAAD